MTYTLSAYSYTLLTATIEHIIENNLEIEPKRYIEKLLNIESLSLLSPSGEPLNEMTTNCRKLLEILEPANSTRKEELRKFTLSISVKSEGFLSKTKIINTEECELNQIVKIHDYIKEFLYSLQNQEPHNSRQIFRMDDFASSLAIYLKLEERGIRCLPTRQFSEFIETIQRLRHSEIPTFFSQDTAIDILHVLPTLKKIKNKIEKHILHRKTPPINENVYLFEKASKILGKELSLKIAKYKDYRYDEHGFQIYSKIIQCSVCRTLFTSTEDFKHHINTVKCRGKMKEHENCLLINPEYIDSLNRILEAFTYFYSRDRLFKLFNGIATHNIQIEDREIDVLIWYPEADGWLIIEASQQKPDKNLNTILEIFKKAGYENTALISLTLKEKQTSKKGNIIYTTPQDFKTALKKATLKIYTANLTPHKP
ncbi:MAG: hypothetical protein DRI61_16790 [Chloroflexi bacterium]|nr:MAG: hypothetical protein DRI61_16790 [Chloroflexota bacterium]